LESEKSTVRLQNLDTELPSPLSNASDPELSVRGKLTALTRAESLLAIFEGEQQRDERALGRIFGEELPSGLVLSRTEAL
jgi:hypothetical protein